MATVIAEETERSLQLSRAMVREYVAWSGAIKHGEVQNALYYDIFDFVNFRIETADTCLDLIERGKIADALGLSRVLLEHYLLFILMCRGHKLFRLENLEEKTPEEFAEILKQRKAELKEQQAAEAGARIAVDKYPHAKRHIMHIYEGLRDLSGGKLMIPAHYFYHQTFNPETLRLKDENYFVYYEPDPELRKAQKDHRREADALYRHYLSYDALLQALELNGLADKKVQYRIEAHYTFLGRFIHPTHEAARELHDRANYYSGATAIGMGQTYAAEAVLLTALYVSYLLAGILEEVAGLLEGAPKKYVADPATVRLRARTGAVPREFPYFWFLYNEAPLYDRYNYAIHHVSDDDLTKYAGYAGVPTSRVPFNQHIYANLQGALGGWSSARCGVYRSPLEK